MLAKFHVGLVLCTCAVAPVLQGGGGFAGRFPSLDGPPGRYRLGALPGAGDDPAWEEFHRIDPNGPTLMSAQPERPAAQPITGVVSLRQLQHRPQMKAVRDLLEAQRYSKDLNAAKAIEKLEQAIQIDPWFREAHMNLGVQYARTQRYDEALGQFYSALAIGSPDALVYSNLAWGYVALGDLRQAEELARKAVALDPNNPPARSLIELVSKR